MITIIILTIIALIISTVAILTVAVGGATFILLFADYIIGAYILYRLIKRIVKRKRRK